MFSVHTYTDLTGISDIKCAWQQHHVADNPPFLRQTEISVCVFAADILSGYSRDVFKFALVGFFGVFLFFFIIWAFSPMERLRFSSQKYGFEAI